MKSRKVLLLTADVAGGHMATGKALKQAWLEKHPNDSFEITDLFEELDIAPFNTSEKSYELFTQNFTLRAINNQIFRLLNTGFGYELWKSYVNSRLYYPTFQFISNYQPDLIITNHPIVSSVVGEVKRREGGFKYAVCVVDIGTIWKCWADLSADLIISPAVSATSQLVRHGIDFKLIEQELFPLRVSLGDVKAKTELLQEYELSPDKPIIVITGGGIGLTAINQVLQSLAGVQEYQLLVICGKLETMREVLSKRFVGNKNMRFLGFVERMQDLYVLADVVISKGGPNTVLEILAFNKKAILTKEIGQQEIGNIDYALSRSELIEPLQTDVRKQLAELIAKPQANTMPIRDLHEVDKIVDNIGKLLS